MGIEVYGIKDAEDLFADIRTEPGGSPDHLLIENAAIHPPQENKICDRGYVNAGGQEIDGNRNLGIGVVPEGTDEVLDLVHAPGNLLHPCILDVPVCLLDVLDDDIGMGVGGSKYQC